MSDEQFHEFHLDGKQMVFLFMASTVVAVVIFLCGVMVGRDVRASRAVDPVAAFEAANEDSPLALPPDEPSSDAESTDSSAILKDELTYTQRLQSQTPL